MWNALADSSHTCCSSVYISLLVLSVQICIVVIRRCTTSSVYFEHVAMSYDVGLWHIPVMLTFEASNHAKLRTSVRSKSLKMCKVIHRERCKLFSRNSHSIQNAIENEFEILFPLYFWLILVRLQDRIERGRQICYEQLILKFFKLCCHVICCCIISLGYIFIIYLFHGM